MTTDERRPVQQLLSTELQTLHRLLLRAEAAAASLSADPYKLMGAAMSDPRFAWLQPLLKLIVALDEADDKGELAAGTTALVIWRRRIEGFIGPAAADPVEFRVHYERWVQRSPEVAASDARLRRLLSVIAAG